MPDRDETKAQYEERLELCLYRLRQIPSENTVQPPFGGFFQKEAAFLLYVIELWENKKTADWQEQSETELREQNHRLYEDILPENYGASYGNPDFACEKLGLEYGRLISLLYSELRGVIVYAYEDRLWDLVVSLELFLECYRAFEDEEIPTAAQLKAILESYFTDYCPEFMDYRLGEMVDPSLDFAARIIRKADLSDLRYLYAFGEYISDNERQTAAFLNTLEQSEIDRMALVWTEGYRLGFAATGKDITKKKTVNIRYSIGFERVIKSAISQFAAIGLKPVLYRAASHRMNCTQMPIGYFGADPNPQFAFDHKADEALYLDEKLVSRKLASLHAAFEKREELSNVHGGPACLETFGEKAFVPQVKKTAYSLTDGQKALKVKYQMQAAELTNRYIIGEERSFTIIAWPIPEIGDKYPEIFKETMKLNTLDYEKWRRIQQKIIDALDQGERVIVKGANGNKTDLVIQLHTLRDPEKETNFENCVADVNIPVGEVFTSPRLEGTGGLLHVSGVYLNGLRYKDLRIWLQDGKTTRYSCANYEDPEVGKKLIRDNILYNHEWLPIGEFAIGTNTTAYQVAKTYEIEDKFPILIAEKTGPHFAFGDTCYSREEDIMTYNPDGKAIVARENECSALRKTHPEQAYFNCHTDITIPYEELGVIYAEKADGERIEIIRDGRFVLEGTKELNEPLEAD